MFGRLGAVAAQAGDYNAAQVTYAAQTNASNTFLGGTSDFSGEAHTLPAVTGMIASIPSTCTVGEMYFATNATAGRNWYFCTAANTWTAQADLVASVFGRTGAVIAQSGDYTAAQVTNAAQINGSNAFTGGTQDFHAAAHTLPAVTGTAASKPSTCTVGETYFATDATAGRNWYFCTAANTWTAQADLVASVFGRTGAVIAQSGDYTAAQVTNAAQTNASNTFSTGTQSFAAAQHIIQNNGTAASKPSTCTVGETYFATDATAGRNWYFCTATNTWTAQADLVASVFGRTGAVTAQSGDYTAAQVTNAAQINGSNAFTGGTQDFHAAAHTLPAVTGTAASKPANCTVGEMYFASDATAGQNWYYCTATNTWTQQVNGGGVASVFGRTGAVVATSGDYTAAQVTNAAQTNASNTFSTGTQSFAAAQHIIQNNGTAASKPSTCTVGETYFATDATAGRNWYFCTATNTWTAQADLVASVFGRTGAVTAQSGDYTAAQVTNAAQTNASNTFSAGTQDFHAAAHTLPAVTGLMASKPATCTVGEMYFATDATAGQNWYYCTASNVWTQQLNSGGGNASITATTVTYSATPTFTRSTNIQEFTLTLTGNVTSSTLTGASAGDILYFNICQNSTGGYTMVFPTGFSQAPTISANASVCTKFSGTWNGSQLQVAGSPTTTDTPFLISQAAERAAPSTPASGYAALWPDSTRHTFTSTENNSANAHIMPRTAGATDQLASADLSDTANINLLNANQTVTGNKTSTGSVDNSGTTHSLPAKVGTAANKPGTCTTGEMYFATDATAGQNWYYCTAANTWTAQAAGGGTGLPDPGSNGIVARTSPGSTAARVLTAGPGITVINGDGGSGNPTISINTAVGLTNAVAQANKPWFCNSTTGNTAFACSLSAAAPLGIYTTGLCVDLMVDTANSGAATLNIDGLGATAIKIGDGITDPLSNQIAAGRETRVCYDGAVFRLPTAVPLATISLDGTTQGTYSALNFVTPVGLNWQLAPSAQTLSIAPTPDTAVVPFKTTANSYVAGAKQSVSPNTATAGLNLSSAPLPSTPAIGDIATDLTGNLNWFDGTAWRLGTVADAVLPAGMPVIGDGTNHVTAGGATGSGSFVMSTAPTISNPMITSFVNSNHDHSNAANGGQLTESALVFSNVTTANATTSQHGLLPQLSGNLTDCFLGTGIFAACPSGSGGGAVSSVFGRTGAVTPQSGDYTATQVLNAAATNASNTFTTGTQNFSSAAHTLPAVTGLTASKPSTCAVGEMYFATDATPGQNWYYCTLVNTWTQQLNSGGGSGYATIDSNGSPVTQRATVNFISGANATVSCIDNSGANRSDCTISSTGGGGGGPTTNQNIRPIPFFAGANGTFCNDVAFGGTIQQVSVLLGTSASATLTFYTGTHSSYSSSGPAGITTKIGAETVSSAYSLFDTTLSSWTTSLAANSVVCIAVSNSSGFTSLSGEIAVAAN